MTAVSAGFASALPVLALALVPLGFVVYCEADLARSEGVRHLPRWLWAVVCAVTVPLGGIVYLAFGRPGTGGGHGAAHEEGATR